MNRSAALLRIVLAALLACAAVVARAAGDAGPTWSGEMVRAAIAEVDVAGELTELYALARAGDDAALLAHIDHIDLRSDWPRPAREFVLFSLTAALADFGPGPGGWRSIERLAEVPSQVRVPHPDDERVGFVLFNIRAAAAGTQTEWCRRAARDRASRLARDDVNRWMEAFAEAGACDRPGFIDALQEFTPDVLAGIARRALAETTQGAFFAELGARAALRLRDPDLLARALGQDSLAPLAPLAREAARALDSERSARLLELMVSTAPPHRSSVVLAELAPALLNRAKGVDALAGLLAHPELGGAAALALAASDDPAHRERLAAFANAGHGWVSHRAANALAAADPTEEKP